MPLPLEDTKSGILRGEGHNVGGIWVAYCIGVDWGSGHEAKGREAWSLVN